MTPLEVLKKYWGYEAFRPMQLDIINAVLEKKDTLALLPTGGGKSICFQVPALVKEGICIVISPLIALMKDQVHNLQKRGISAIAIYSGMHYKEIDRAFDNCIYGNIKFLYLSPERLNTEIAKQRIEKMNVNLIAVDEAHCISQWGYDFRPPYLDIINLRTLKPHVPIIALTATATSDVVVDIQEKLGFEVPNVFRKSFERENLTYLVLREENKSQRLVNILRKMRGSGVVYVRNRRKTKEFAMLLQRNRIRADYYHAGLNNQVRMQKQDAWINDKTRIMVATNAFGMGIDKPDVRVVIHLGLPDTLEAYFQEAGRGGRDGKQSYAILLYNDADRELLERQYELSFPEWSAVQQVYQALGSYFQLAVGSGREESFDFDIIDFCSNYKLKVLKVFNCLKILEQAGWLIVTEAVLIPSSVRVKATKERIYDYALKNRNFDLLIKRILRNYQGAFNNFVKIDEYQLARSIKITKEQLNKGLLWLQKDDIIEYLPAKDKPQIIFTKARTAIENLTIDQGLYKFRKERYKKSIEAAINYATKEQCRSQLLLNYFSESEVKKCEKCDHCRDMYNATVTTEEYKIIGKAIMETLQRQPLALKQLVLLFSTSKERKVLTVVDRLKDSNWIIERQYKLHWNDRRKKAVQ